MKSLRIAVPLWAIGILLWTPAHGQFGPPPGPPPAPRVAAPVDLTGYWVSLVTEDWRFRMVTAPKGDFTSVPVNAAGKKATEAWDPAKDEAAGDQCKAYGAAGIVRMPGRLHITWQDDRTLKVDFDAGTQARIISFDPPKGPGGDWQGLSAASWDQGASLIGFAFGLGGGGGPRGGSLKVTTTKMKAGYLRKNGVPYSANATMLEYFDRFDVPGGDTLLVVTSEVTDPANLSEPYWTSTHFKKQDGAAGWNPTPCTAR